MLRKTSLLPTDPGVSPAPETLDARWPLPNHCADAALANMLSAIPVMPMTVLDIVPFPFAGTAG